MVSRLENIIWNLNARLYGERTEKEPNIGTPVADNLSSLFERINVVNKRLEQIDGALNIIK